MILSLTHSKLGTLSVESFTVPLIRPVGDVVVDPNGNPLKIRQILISVCLRQLHIHMMKDVSDGGYKNAKEVSPTNLDFSPHDRCILT